MIRIHFLWISLAFCSHNWLQWLRSENFLFFFVENSKFTKREIARYLFVLNLNCVRELHGADVAGVGAGDGDYGGFRQFLENPIGLGAAVPERRDRGHLLGRRGWRRRRRRRFHLDVAGAAAGH